MPFPIAGKMAFNEFRKEIIDHYWADIDGAIKKSAVIKAKNKDELANDYARIGSFLSDKNAVAEALEGLEAKIRAAIKQKAKDFPQAFTEDRTKKAVTPSKYGGAGSGKHFKADKLLTDALRQFEQQEGFNHEKIMNGTFFDDAKGTLHKTAAFSDAQGNLTPVGLPDGVAKDKATGSKATTVPRGVPTVVGDLDPVAFNVLLRHGYQFKDVAAGPYHGEYTHRLQWYAAMHAKDLGIVNAPLDIFKSLGYLTAKADKNVPADGGTQLWMWQALFDTAETEARAKTLRTLAYATHASVFTCPENMNKGLMALNPADTFASNPLWCLRVLLLTRWKKRFDSTDETFTPAKPTFFNKLDQKLKAGKATAISSHTLSVVEKTGVRVKARVMEPNPKLNKDGELDYTQTREVTRMVDETKMVERQPSTVFQAGYALAWYLADDAVK